MLGLSSLGYRTGTRFQGLTIGKSSSASTKASVTSSSRASRPITSSFAKNASSATGLAKASYSTVTKIEPLIPVERKAGPASFTVPVLNLATGEATESVELKTNIFGVPVRTDLLHQMVVWHLANTRRGLANTKGRGEVAGSTRKVYKQKGTGNARVGSVRATQRVGSGAAHGPHPKNWKFKVNTKVRKLAMASALSAKFAQGNLTIVDGLTEFEGKTKNAAQLSEQFKWEDGGALIIGGEKSPATLAQAAANIHYIDVKSHSGLSVYHILKRKHLVLSKETLELLDKHVPEQ